MTRGSSDVMSYTADASGQRIALVLSSATKLGDLNVLDPSSGSLKKLTTFNDALFDQLAMNEPEEIWYKSFDGRNIQGWILKPPDFDPSKKYPLILEIHGGPYGNYNTGFNYMWQNFAANGFVVLYLNPRGSTGYGQAFIDGIDHNYPGPDYDDLMSGVDALTAKGFVDANLMYVSGCSVCPELVPLKAVVKVVASFDKPMVKPFARSLPRYQATVALQTLRTAPRSS